VKVFIKINYTTELHGRDRAPIPLTQHASRSQLNAPNSLSYLDFAGASDTRDDIPKLKNALKAESNHRPNSSTSTFGACPLNHPRLTKQDLQHVVNKQAEKDFEIWGLEYLCVCSVQMIHRCGMKSLSSFVNKAQDTIWSEMDNFGLMNGSMKASNNLSDKTESSGRAPFGRIEVGVVEFPRLDVMLSRWLEERLVHLLD